MAQPPFRDLPPRYDVKGGAPRTPTVGIPVSQFQTQVGFFKSNLFIFLMGQVVTFLIALIFFAVGWGKLSEQFTENQAWRNSAEARLTRMDEFGTNHSKYQLDALRSKDEEIIGRLKAVEDQDRIIPVLKEKIDRLESNRSGTRP